MRTLFKFASEVAFLTEKDYKCMWLLLAYKGNEMTKDQYEKQYTKSLFKKRMHYAWAVCFSCALMFFCTCGLSCNVFGVYSPFIKANRGFTNAQISLISTFRSASQMIAITLAGKYYRRLKLRSGMLIAGLTCAAGYVVYGLSRSFPVYLCGSMVVGFGYGLGGMVPIAMVLERWFYKDRTLAVSMASAASGLATIGVPSLITALIQKFGASYAFLVEAGIMVVLVFLAFLIVRDNPSDKSIHAFGYEEQKAYERMTAAAPQPEKVPTIPKAGVLLVYLMIGLGCAFNSAGYGNLSMLGNTEGFSPEQVAIAISAEGTMLMAGKLIFGVMSEKITLYKTSLIYGTLGILSTASLCFIRISPVFFVAVSAVFGFSLTLLSVGAVAWTADWFPPKDCTEMARRFQLAYSIGSLINSVIPGIMADRFGGSYVPFYAYAAVCHVIVMIILIFTYRSVRFTEGSKNA